MSDPDPSPESRGLAVTPPSRRFHAEPGLDLFYAFISAGVIAPSEVGAKSSVRFICICEGNPQVESEDSDGILYNLVHFPAERNCSRGGIDLYASNSEEAHLKQTLLVTPNIHHLS